MASLKETEQHAATQIKTKDKEKVTTLEKDKHSSTIEIRPDPEVRSGEVT